MALESYFTFQQDCAPADRAIGTIEVLRRDTPDFIPSTVLRPDSSDLNPIDHEVLSVMEEQVCHTPIQATFLGCVGGMKSGSMKTKM